MKGGESCLDTVGRKAFRLRPEARSRGQKSRDGASCGETCLSQRRVNATKALDCWLRHTALHPLACVGGKETGFPGATTKNTGDNAWLFEN